MKIKPNVIILCGGISGEREISINSARVTEETLKQFYSTKLICLDINELPNGIDKYKDLVFPLIHGDFGEDGKLQLLLEKEGIGFVGSGSKASFVCIDKIKSKNLAKKAGIPVLPGYELKGGCPIDTNLFNGNKIVVKPTDKGSSIGVEIFENVDKFNYHLNRFKSGNWMVERFAGGRELTVGVLQGEPLGVVEIKPKDGFYDYKNKYTKGACSYLFPAQIPENITNKIREIASTFYKIAGCMDFGRADFLLEPNGDFWFLEMNTIPGMTEQSLFPKSASCCGLSFGDVLKELINGAVMRNVSNFSK